MSPPNTQPDLIHVKKLFDQLSLQPIVQREAFIQGAGLSPHTERELRRLLQVLDEGQENDGVGVIEQHLKQIHSNHYQGQMLGPFRIDREVGKGGMGIVFQASRQDGQFDQQVAIKVVPVFASQNELLHFENERQLLANLNHPNIATLFDGGITADGRPYIVMELIEGETLNDFSKSQQLNINDKLALFCDVCDAVHYAHSHLVIHRDIKPENVMVNRQGQVKLLDFGTSKLLEASHDNRATRSHALTLVNAAPEQLLGEPTTTETDVYGLGALLYTLLTEKPPYQLEQDNFADAIKTICLAQPVLPHKHNAEVHADLSNIVLKAMDKDPSQRYASARELKADVQRFVKQLPVRASKQGLAYRAGKFFRRHPIPIALSGALFVATLIGMVGITRLNQQLLAEQQRLLTTQSDLVEQTRTANQVINLLTDMFDAASPDNTFEDNIDVEDLIASAVSNTHQSLTDAPKAKSRLLDVLADVQHKLGNGNEATSLLEASVAIKSEHGMAITLDDYVRLGRAYHHAGEFDSSLEALNQAAELVVDQISLDAAKVNAQLGNHFKDTGDDKRALELLLSAEQTLKTIDYPMDDWYLDILYDIANLHDQVGNYTQASQVLEYMIQQRTMLFGEGHPSMIEGVTFLGYVYNKMGRQSDYLEVTRRAYEIGTKAYSVNKRTLNWVVLNYVNALENQGRFTEALALLEDQLVPELNNVRSKGLYFSARASIYYELGLFQQALQDYERAYEMLNPSWGNNLHTMFSLLYARGGATGRAESKSLGIQQLQELERKVTEAWGKDALPISSIWTQIAQVYMHHNEPDLAKPFIDKVRDLYTGRIPDDHPAFVEYYLLLARFFELTNNWQQALVNIDTALRIFQATAVSESLGANLMQLRRGMALWHLGRTAEAEQIYQAHASAAASVLPDSSAHYPMITTLQRLLDQNPQ